MVSTIEKKVITRMKYENNLTIYNHGEFETPLKINKKINVTCINI